MKKNTALIFTLIATTIFALPSFAQNAKDLRIIRETNKVALVIGNSDYKNGFSKLNSPRNDAAAMAAALKRLGFRLVGDKAHLDATFEEMEKLVDRLTDELKNGGVGFFYFSGHGSQDGFKDNFLIPVNTSINYQSDLKHKALKVEFVTSRMEVTGNRLNILVLDACRNNPLPSGDKSGGKGLNTNSEVPSGVYIAFAARDGQVAADGDYGGYSLYTRELLKNIEEPNERLEDIFIATRAAVKNETKNRQSPFDYGSIDGRFYFKFEGQASFAGNNSNTGNSSNNIEEAKAFFNAAFNCGSTNYDCQISNYSKAINVNPNYADAYNNRGNSYGGKQNYDRAIEDFTKAIQLNPGFAEAYNNRAVTYNSKQNYERAIEDFTKAIQLNPNFAEAYNNRGITYYYKRDYDRAIEDYNKAIQLNPDNADVYSSRGNSFYGKQNYKRSAEDYTKAIQLNPNNPSYYRNRANSYDIIGEKSKAEADRRKADALEKP